MALVDRLSTLLYSAGYYVWRYGDICIRSPRMDHLGRVISLVSTNKRFSHIDIDTDEQREYLECLGQVLMIFRKTVQNF